MAKTKNRYFEFRQNNSGGSFDINDAQGIGPRVWIEAVNLQNAILRAEGLGLYWDGVDKGMDCPCCGDRWSHPWDEEGVTEVKPDPEYDFNWHPVVYVHRIGGKIERIKGKSKYA